MIFNYMYCLAHLTVWFIGWMIHTDALGIWFVTKKSWLIRCTTHLQGQTARANVLHLVVYVLFFGGGEVVIILAWKNQSVKKAIIGGVLTIALLQMVKPFVVELRTPFRTWALRSWTWNEFEVL